MNSSSRLSRYGKRSKNKKKSNSKSFFQYEFSLMEAIALLGFCLLFGIQFFQLSVLTKHENEGQNLQNIGLRGLKSQHETLIETSKKLSDNFDHETLDERSQETDPPVVDPDETDIKSSDNDNDPAYIDPNWTPPGPGRYLEYKDGSNVFFPLTPNELEKSDDKARSRRIVIRNAMKHAWNGYKTYAWGKDELFPQSKKSRDNWGGIGTTLVDSLDTLWLMGMKEEFWEARDWVRDSLVMDKRATVSVFETTIRNLGGLLSAYDWSGDDAFLDKAKDLGDRLFFAFKSASGLPNGQVNLHDHSSGRPSWVGNKYILSEVGSLQIEFRHLTKITGDEKYADKVNKVFSILKTLEPKDSGLYPYFIAADISKYANRRVPFGDDKRYFPNKQVLLGVDKPRFANNLVSFGSMGDSFYEYMLKIWLQGGRKENMYREMYDKAMDGLHENLIVKTPQTGLTLIAEKDGTKLKREMEHLVCFLAGTLALGAYTHPDGLESPKAQRDLKTGKALAYTCYQMYAQTKTGIGPEIVKFPENEEMKVGVPYYILRPETVESLFILNQLTGDPTYREWGWEIFQAIERFCKTEFAYGGREDVNNPNEAPTDEMESFFLAETLKYLYLLQDPDTEVDILNKHVFNTEAHPLQIFNSS